MARNTLSLIFLVICMTWFTSCLGEKSIQKYLEQFGYLAEETGLNRGQETPPEKLSLAISSFQKFNGLDVTGVLDKATKKKMIKPRCGVKDIEQGAAFRKVTKWNKSHLTWSIKNFSQTSSLNHYQQSEAIKKGFRHWSRITPLIFSQVQRGGDIVIKFAKGKHGDGNSFDGRGGVLAHAFFPSNGDTHFDDSEEWTINTEKGTNLEIVAAHEFGHALGLAHSQVSEALMAPYYRGYIPNFKLHVDDVRGIQSLYGNRRQTSRPDSTTRRPMGNGYCNQQYRKVVATMRVLNRVDYVFVDQKYVISSETGRKFSINTVFKHGPGRVEAAIYSEETNEVYLAYGRRLWAFGVRNTGTAFTLEYNYPITLSNSNAAHMEAMMGLTTTYGYHKSVRIFVIKEGYFWELMPKHRYISDGRGYSTSRFFINIPKRIDSVLSVNDKLYFLSNNKFYKMSISNRQVSSYGLPMKKVLLPCKYR